MVTAVSAAAADLCTAFIALEIFSFLSPQLGADPSAQAPLLDSATAVSVIYRRLQHPSVAAGAAGSGNRRLWGLFAILCASAGSLDFFFFVQPAGIGGGDAGEQARALALAAARVLPAAAAATFFLGMVLIIVAHIRAGGEGGGGGFAADGQIQGAVLFLTKAAYAAAAALALLMSMALCVCGDTAIY